MRDHSSRRYNKSKVTRFTSKSQFKATGPQKVQRFRASALPPKLNHDGKS